MRDSILRQVPLFLLKQMANELLNRAKKTFGVGQNGDCFTISYKSNRTTGILTIKLVAGDFMKTK